MTEPNAAEVQALQWNKVEDGLPKVYGDYLVVREHAELHSVSIDVTTFHPLGSTPWFDRGFNYLYWIGPITIPKELEPKLIGNYLKKHYKVATLPKDKI